MGVLVLFCGDDQDHIGAIELWRRAGFFQAGDCHSNAGLGVIHASRQIAKG